VSVNDSVFNTSFVLFRLRAGLSFSFEQLEQNGVASFLHIVLAVSFFDLGLMHQLNRHVNTT